MPLCKHFTMKSKTGILELKGDPSVAACKLRAFSPLLALGEKRV